MQRNGFEIARVRTRLLLDQPFFGTLAMHLQTVEDPGVETLCTNGVELRFNPAYLGKLTPAEQTAVLAHEVLHCGLLHPYRRAGREPREWNEACDFAVNSQLIASGFTLPAGVLIDPQYDGMSAEQIYSKRRSQSQEPPPSDEPEPEEQPGDDSEDGDKDGAGDRCSECGDDLGDGEGFDGKCGSCADAEAGDGENSADESSIALNGAKASLLPSERDSSAAMPGCPTGEFIDGPATAEAPGELTAADWAVIAAEAAAVAERAGDLPGGIGRALKATREPRVDWKAETRAFVTNTVETDYSWATPNRRFISRGLYVPGAMKDNVGPLVVGVDTSASITQAQLDEFANELSGLMRDARPERLHVVYCDARVQGTAEFTPDDPEVKLTLAGGGGTRFQPVFDYVEEQQLDPLGLIYLTDLEGPAPALPPYPVLWVTPQHATYPAPFGQLVRMP